MSETHDRPRSFTRSLVRAPVVARTLRAHSSCALFTRGLSPLVSRRARANDAISRLERHHSFMSDGLVCGEIVSCDAIEGKDKLKRLTVRVVDGDDDDGARLQIVTNAPNVDVGKRCVVAKIGSTLRDGTEVKKASVGGVTSEGMLCDSAMCGWSGGGAGAAALLPGDFPLGAAPPSSRLRLDGKSNDDAGDDEAARRAQKMKEKEDKKKALAEKRAARDAARKAKKAGEGGDA